MFCPNCGEKTSIDQNFCRACGLSLEKTALSLSEQLPAKVDQSLQAQKERLEKLGVAALSVFGLGLLVVIVYSIGKKFISNGDLFTLLVMLGFLIMIACGLTSVVLFAKAKDLGEKSSKRPQQNLSTGSEPTKDLLTEGHFEPVPTVTERTTELLAVNKRDTNRH
ncbi:MAG TPA: zinc ribbon domain-containing protein [Pyrinomonadaceae bacterium]|nr:zinc ribbon domain-containing protein [Pyrinomonadaceae bacterium]